MSRPDVIDSFQGENRFLSNMFPLDFWIITNDGLAVPSSEHKYMSERFANKAIRAQIAECRATPKQNDKHGFCANGIAAKALARSFMEEGEAFIDEPEKKLVIMEGAVYAKFKLNPHLAKRLLETGDTELIEGNNWGDTFWGVCDGEGENNLGKILMQTRQQLREEQI